MTSIVGSAPSLHSEPSTLRRTRGEKNGNDSTRRVIGNSAKLAATARPADPTSTEPSELQRIRAAKWLPPLADNARVPTPPHFLVAKKLKGNNTKDGIFDAPRAKEESLGRLMKQTRLPNINLSKARFPKKELQKCHQMKTHLRNNTNQRFLIALREQAVKIDEKAAKRAAEIEKAHQNEGIMWDLLRPLSREPMFEKYIQTLQEFGMQLNYAPETVECSETSSAASSAPQSPLRSKISTYRNTSVLPKSVTPLNALTRSARPLPSLDAQLALLKKKSVGSKSLDNLILSIEGSVFRPKRKGARAIRGNEEDVPEDAIYQFGKPAVLKVGQAEEYAETFKAMQAIGREVGQSMLESERDKRSFSNIRDSRHWKSKGSVKPQTEISRDRGNGFSKPPTAKEYRKDPSLLRRSEFLKWQENGQRDLQAALKARKKEQFAACKDAERLRKVMNVIQQDINLDFYLHSPFDSKHWMSVLPHIWVEDSDELLKELDNPILKQLNARNRSNANAPLITLATLAKERAFLSALVATHSRATALAGHTRLESVVNAARRQDEYVKMVEGKDVVVERGALADMCSDVHLEVLFGKKGIQGLPGQPLQVTAGKQMSIRQSVVATTRALSERGETRGSENSEKSG